jgi:hypothetical protein
VITWLIIVLRLREKEKSARVESGLPFHGC